MCEAFAIYSESLFFTEAKKNSGVKAVESVHSYLSLNAFSTQDLKLIHWPFHFVKAIGTEMHLVVL